MYKAPKREEFGDYAVFYRDWETVQKWMELHGVASPKGYRNEQGVLDEMFGKDRDRCTCLLLSEDKCLHLWLGSYQTRNALTISMDTWLRQAEAIPVHPSVFLSPQQSRTGPPADLEF